MNDKAETNYHRALEDLPTFVHGRNGQLVRIAHLGLAAGRDKVTLAAEIVAAGGEPRLTDREVTRAIEKALRSHADNRPAAGRSFGRAAVAHAKPAGPSVGEQGFVRRQIEAGRGATSKSLMASSPVPVTGPEAVAAFLRRLFRPDELVFAGTPFTPRTRENLRSAEALAAALAAGAPPPTHFAPNPFTGESALNEEGKVSFCLDRTVARRRHALIEFDALPLADQAAFWAGVIDKRLLPVRSLVYSGAKSIHGLVELDDDGSEATWRQEWAILERLLCSAPDPACHADRACKNPSRLTRFPAAIRPETARPQTLLWLSA